MLNKDFDFHAPPFRLTPAGKQDQSLMSLVSSKCCNGKIPKKARKGLQLAGCCFGCQLVRSRESEQKRVGKVPRPCADDKAIMKNYVHGPWRSSEAHLDHGTTKNVPQRQAADVYAITPGRAWFGNSTFRQMNLDQSRLFQTSQFHPPRHCLFYVLFGRMKGSRNAYFHIFLSLISSTSPFHPVTSVTSLN